MKLTRVYFLSLLLFLLVPSASYAQTAADKAWKPFWTKFSAAVNNKNFNALNALTLKPFDSGGGAEDTLAEFFQGDKKWKNEIWRSLSEAVKSGTSPTEKINGKPARTSNNNYTLFVYTKNGWRFWGLWGD
ncbi:MAG TPA: hypothetical protein PKY59_14375 [Pyrinomonadaceae bacterium]|nr:hypothetical protein [Pyrinomonadaceae bacterium]